MAPRARGTSGESWGLLGGSLRPTVVRSGPPWPPLALVSPAQWPGLLSGSAGKQLSDWSSKCRLLWFGIWIMEVKSFCQSQETVGLRLTSYLWSDWLPIFCSWPFIIASDVMVQQSWWAHKLLHSAFLPVITQTFAATIRLLFQSWNWLWPWGGSLKQQYCISRSRVPDRLPLLHCAETKEEAMAFCLHLGFILLVRFYAVWNRFCVVGTVAELLSTMGLLFVFLFVTFLMI